MTYRTYDDYTEQAKFVMVLANHEAQRLNHEEVGTGHILLGIVSIGMDKNKTCIASRILTNKGMDYSNVRREVKARVQPSAEPVTMGQEPLTPSATTVLRYATDEAHGQKVNPEHLLLGLLREQDIVAGSLLREFGVELDEVRRLLEHAS